MKLITALNETKNYKKAAARELMKFVIEFQKKDGKIQLLLNSYNYNNENAAVSALNTDLTKSETFPSSSVEGIRIRITEIIRSFKYDLHGKERRYKIHEESFNAFFSSLKKAIQNYSDINVAMDTPSTGGLWDVRFYITEYLTDSSEVYVRIGGIHFSQGEEKEIAPKKKRKLFSK